MSLSLAGKEEGMDQSNESERNSIEDVYDSRRGLQLISTRSIVIVELRARWN